MKALRKLKPEMGIWLTDVEKPKVGHNDILIKVKKTGICGTDIHIYTWDDWAKKTLSLPLTIGHEFVGVIEDMGVEVTGFKKGERVSAEGHITCGHCRNCRAGKRHLCPKAQGIGSQHAGCFAEYIVMPAINVFHVPEGISDDIAAILDPLGNAVHAALSSDLVGEDVLITGAGPVGMMAIAVAKRAGARYVVITDVSDYRLSIAQHMGATHAINIQKHSIKDIMKELNMKEGFDVGLEMSGSPEALNQMLDVMVNGGHISLLGFMPDKAPIDWTKIVFKGLFLKGIYGREMFETWHKMTALLQCGLDISPVLTHHFPVTDYQQAFEIMRTGHCGKIVLDWNHL